MKSFDEAIQTVMSSGKEFSSRWTFTTDVVNCKQLEKCLETGLQDMPECCPPCARKFMVAVLMAAFELGMCTGIEMEKAE